MTVSLSSLIEEWEAINQDLYKASLESHRRYPFPSNLFNTHATIAPVPAGLTSSSTLPSSSSADSSTGTYARVYFLVARVRYIAEDARYNSFNILQHLIWVTIVAWANQLAVASGGRITLPANIRQLNAEAPPSASEVGSRDKPSPSASAAAPATASRRSSFPCPLLSALTFWDPKILAEAAGTESPTGNLVHRAPNLPAVWADAVQRIVALWCTPLPPTSPASDSLPDDAAISASRKPNSKMRQKASGSHLNDAYIWVILSQHYHRFKAILSLFFLRYDAHLEELEEQQRRLGNRPPPSSLPHAAEPGEALGGVAAAFPSTQPLRRRVAHLRVPSDVSTTSFSPNATRATTGNTTNSNSHQSNTERPLDSGTAASRRRSMPLPTTARLLATIMRSIETENIHTITGATGEAVLSLLMPPVHRARLREKVLKVQKQQQRIKLKGADNGGRVSDDGGSANTADPSQQYTNEDPLTEPECMASAFLEGCAAEEEEDDDDKVVWSAPPSPLLSFDRFATLPPGISLTPVDEYLSPDDSEIDTQKTNAVTRVSPVLERAQKEEYVIRNVFKLLLMTEDCRVYALQHWLVEAGKHVVAVYGSQLAALFFEEPGSNFAAAPASSEGKDHRDAPVSPALTIHTLADANRVLRETIQSYVRLRTKLLFLNAGTTHFLEALTPWGRTRMLENLNAFLCGFCGVTLPSSAAAQAEIAATGGTRTAAATLSSTSSSASTTDAAQYFTPTNAAVAAFARTWAVPLWLAMCEDTQHRLEALQAAKQRREDKKKSIVVTEGPRSYPLESMENSEKANGNSGELSEGRISSGSPRSPSFSTKVKRGPEEGNTMNAATRVEARNAMDGQKTSIASADLGDAVSQAPSSARPPYSPTRGSVVAATYSGIGNSTMVGSAAVRITHNYTRARSRGVDLRRVLQQHQRQRVPFDSLPPRIHSDTAAGRGTTFNSDRNGSDSGGLEESLYSAETASMGETSLFFAATAGGNVNADSNTQNNSNINNRSSGETNRGDYANSAEAESDYRRADPAGGARLVTPANSVEAAVAAARQRRRQSATAAAHEQRTILGVPGTMQCFSRAAQLHQVATLPDEGFPSLMYLMPRRSRFVAQDKAAASVQQELFTRFSGDVHKYLVSFLAKCETSGENKEGAIAVVTAADTNETATATMKTEAAPSAKHGAQKTKTKKRDMPTVMDGEVRPLPQPILTHMIFLLDMTYAALQGSDLADSHHGHTTGPLMETGLTATGQELGAAILEQNNGEYESVVSTTLSAPTSPAVLTIVAVRKGFQGFLASQEKRAVLTLAQALYGLLQQGRAQQPPTVSLKAVDTILNMASLLNSKDMFVSLIKGYIAPQVMMCRGLNDIAVESQVVARMAYRLGSAVAAPCLTLLRDLRLAMCDSLTAANAAGSLSLPNGGDDGVRNDDSGAYYQPENNSMTAEGAQLVATRYAQTLAGAAPLRHGIFGLIHRIRVLCQAWWQPHTAVLLSSRKLQRLWERYQLLDERVVDAVLRVEWLYDGHTEPFNGYGRLAGGVEIGKAASDETDGLNANHKSKGCRRSSVSNSGLSAGTRSSAHRQQQQQQQRRRGSQTHQGDRGGMHGSSFTTTANTRRGGTAAAVIQSFSALGNAVRRTGHHSGAFGNNESDNESEDYSEAYGGLLTLNTLQRHRGAYTASNSSYRGSNVSSMGGGGTGATGDYWDVSDGGQSTVADEAAPTTVPPDGERERRQLRWPLSDGQLVFLIYPKGGPSAAAVFASQAVQISGPPLTLIVCQLMDRAAHSNPYTFDRLHKALPVHTPKSLLAHLLHELVKAGVVLRSVPAGTRQYVYQLRDDVQHLPQRNVVMDVRAAAQQQWVTRTLTAAESDAEQMSQRDPMSPATPTRANVSFSSGATHGGRGPQCAARHSENAAGSNADVQQNSEATAATTAPINQTFPAYSAERTHKIKVCIVRIMKSERVLPHRELLERVAAALENQFVVTSGQFKRCVAHLIEREFLQRSEGIEQYMYLT